MVDGFVLAAKMNVVGFIFVRMIVTEKIKSLPELREHLLDWISQCNMKIINLSVEVARSLKTQNFPAAERDIRILSAYSRERTIATMLNELIDVGEIQVAQLSDLKNITNKVI